MIRILTSNAVPPNRAMARNIGRFTCLSDSSPGTANHLLRHPLWHAEVRFGIADTRLSFFGSGSLVR